jgi:tRNA pseudouridine55 synthase
LKDEGVMIEAVNGILIVNKPKGWTSHDVCDFIRRRFLIRKVGHAGILDRTATGVLVMLLGFYTKFSDRFIKEDKQYVGTLELGKKTTTHDSGGDVIQAGDWSHVTEKMIEEAFSSFRGVIEQLPPMASAIKLHGVRLYKLARQGKEVDRPKKQVTVYELSALKISLPWVDFSSTVSKGTYVRTLVNDIGTQLGCFAFLRDLCRVRSGMFTLEDSVTIEELKNLPSREALKSLLRIPVLKQVTPTAVEIRKP